MALVFSFWISRVFVFVRSPPMRAQTHTHSHTYMVHLVDLVDLVDLVADVDLVVVVVVGCCWLLLVIVVVVVVVEPRFLHITFQRTKESPKPSFGPG